jgi:ferredoxin
MMHQEIRMPRLTVEGAGAVQVPHGKRLVLALEDEAAIDQLHICGGKGKCTTCRVEFVAGEPATMTTAEREALLKSGLLNSPGVRLSCQILCEHSMEVRAISRLGCSGYADTGPRPDEEIPESAEQPAGC